MLPGSEYFSMSRRIIKIGILSEYVRDWLRYEVGIQAPFDKAALFVLFIFASYMPAMIAAIFYTALCKKPDYPKFDPANHVFNRPDALEMTKVL